MQDLWPSTSEWPRNSPGKPQHRKQTNGKPGKTYPTCREAVADLEHRRGKRSALWTYHDANDNPVGVVVRWDTPTGKDFRPVSRNGDGWAVGGMPAPHPLYELPKLADAKRVFVVEGEKCADTAWSIGLVATTSPHGSSSADKADWTPLAGRECVLLPDNDNAGRKYADAVASILAKLDPPARVKIVELPGLSSGGDVVDWIDGHGDAAEPDELRQQLETLVDAAHQKARQGPLPPLDANSIRPTSLRATLASRNGHEHDQTPPRIGDHGTNLLVPTPRSPPHDTDPQHHDPLTNQGFLQSSSDPFSPFGLQGFIAIDVMEVGRIIISLASWKEDWGHQTRMPRAAGSLAALGQQVVD